MTVKQSWVDMLDWKKHLLSRREAILIFTAVLLPVQFWMLYNVLLAVPSYVLRLSVWDLVGFIAYTQAFALFESLLFFTILAAVIWLAPLTWRSERLLAGLGTSIFIISFWSILIHLGYEEVIQWGARQLGIWLMIILSTGLLFIWLVTSKPRLTGAVISFLDRASVLAALYLVIDVFCLIIVGLRNVITTG